MKLYLFFFLVCFAEGLMNQSYNVLLANYNEGISKMFVPQIATQR